MESELNPASCPKEKLELDDCGEVADDVDPSGIPPRELLVLAAVLVLELDGMPKLGLVLELDGAAFVLELDGMPKLGLVLELDGENSPERLDTSGG